MRVLRTPDRCFDDLPGWPHAPRYTTLTGTSATPVRLHHVDTGPPGAGEVVVSLHAVPAWAYLWRHELTAFASAGVRAIACDLAGFGRSDKPADEADHTVEHHLDWLTAWLDAQSLPPVTLVAHASVAAIAATLAADNPGQVRRLVLAGEVATAAPAAARPAGPDAPAAVGAGVADTVEAACRERPLPSPVRLAFAAPFPAPAFAAGPRAWASGGGTLGTGAARGALARWRGPVLSISGTADPSSARHAVISGAGPIVVEDRPRELAEAVVRFIADDTGPTQTTGRVS